MKYYFPIHLNSGNRGCEAIAKGTALILKENKENILALFQVKINLFLLFCQTKMTAILFLN